MLTRFSEIYRKQPKFSIHPDFVAENVHTIDFELLKSYGIRTCFIDLDNTVVERDMFDVSEDIKAALRQSGMQIFIATNRPKSRDLKNLRESLNASGVIHPYSIFPKPTKHYFLHALKTNNLRAHETVMIGDRYLQDVLGANRAGIYSLLVHKLGKPHSLLENFISGIERRLTSKYTRRYTR
ncbi:MAG: HAD-IA family hydrolase [bacterium]|nr:HAD-IA family hydrolase [bacterium]